MLSTLGSKKKNGGFIQIYSSLKSRVGSCGREESPMKEELGLLRWWKTHYHEKECVNSLHLNLHFPLWLTGVRHVGTGSSKLHLLSLGKQKAQTSVLHASDPEVTEYWEMGNVFHG